MNITKMVIQRELMETEMIRKAMRMRHMKMITGRKIMRMDSMATVTVSRIIPVISMEMTVMRRTTWSTTGMAI